MKKNEISNSNNISLVRKLLYGAVGSIIGTGIGVLIKIILDKLISYELCEFYILGLLSGYDCPWWHPHSWSNTLIMLGFTLGPSALSVISNRFFKKKLYNPIKALVVALIVAFIAFISLTLILNLFSPIVDIA